MSFKFLFLFIFLFGHDVNGYQCKDRTDDALKDSKPSPYQAEMGDILEAFDGGDIQRMDELLYSLELDGTDKFDAEETSYTSKTFTLVVSLNYSSEMHFVVQFVTLELFSIAQPNRGRRLSG